MALFQDSPLAFLLSTAVLLITTSSFLALSISLHSAYLWLAVVFIALIFLATFTCTYSLPGYFVEDVQQDNSSTTAAVIDGQTNFTVEADTDVPYWVAIDLPPSYDMAVGILPPSYSKATSGMVKLDLSEGPIYNGAEPIHMSLTEGSVADTLFVT